MKIHKKFTQKIHLQRYLQMFLTLTLFVSCVELKDDIQGEITSESFYSSESDLKAAVNSIYFPIAQSFGLNQRAAFMWSADDITTLAGGNKGEYKEYDVFNPTNTNSKVKDSWKNYWASILAANSVLDNYESIPDIEEDVRNAQAAQANFIRALTYFELTRIFGKVPLITSAVGITGQEEKAEISEIYDVIIADLVFAVNNLPEAWAGEPGRPTKWSAESLLANVYLTTAGFPLNITENYAKAADHAGNVIQNGPYDLVPNFADLWDSASTASENVENVFAFQFCQSCGGWGYGNYKSKQFHQWDDMFAELTFFNNFPAGPRKDATFITNFRGKDYSEVNHKHPEYRKFGTFNSQGVEIKNSHDQDYYYMRFAEVLLIYAEAKIMASGNTSESTAIEALNRVKTRAGIANVTSANQMDVVTERGWEKAGEFSRWYDLVRTQQIDEVVATRDSSEHAIDPSHVDESNPWAKIPAEDISLNPNLK